MDDDFSQTEMMRGLAQETVQEAFKTEVKSLMRNCEMTISVINTFTET